MISPGKLPLLIVDDEPDLCEVLTRVLSRADWEVECALSAEAALEKLRITFYPVILQDIKLPGMDGLELLKRLKARPEPVMVIIMTAFSTWESAVQAMRLGAYDYLKKPFDNEILKTTLARAHEHYLQMEQAPSLVPDRHLLGNSPRIQEVLTLIRLVAPTDSTVLISGRSGVGKELAARLLHQLSHRRHRPFIALNCATFPETLLESELFGHVKGAFTGAVSDKQGLFEVARAGTIFLDEISETPLEIQGKLLRVLENRTFLPVGGTAQKTVDVRFLTATNRNLEERVKTGAFREDLFFRLNVIPVALPTLAERREDLPVLAGHFLSLYAQKMGKPVHAISREALEKLMAYDWPGNVRELSNTIERAVALCPGEEITLAQLLPAHTIPRTGPGVLALEVPPAGLDLEDTLARYERTLIESALRHTKGNLTQAAGLLKTSFRSLRYRAKKLGL